LADTRRSIGHLECVVPDVESDSSREPNVLKQRNTVLVVLIVASLFATGAALAGTAFAQKAGVPKPQDKVALARENAKEILLLMDTDKDGKIPKGEWRRFMEAKFDRLDAEKKGRIDPEELLQSTVSVKHPRTADLGK
jgi:hypothetical protein